MKNPLFFYVIALWVGVVLCLSFGITASAATVYRYTSCGDLTSGDSPACTAAVWSKGSAFSLIDNTNSKPLAAGTWYISATVTGGGTPFRITCYEYSGSVCNTYGTLSSGTNTDVSFTINSGSSVGIYLWGQSSGSIGDICVTDTAGGCAATPVGPDASYAIFGTSTATYQIVDNPTADTFYLLVLFTSWFFGIYWVFSKKR